jgi:hypothetical protein
MTTATCPSPPAAWYPSWHATPGTDLWALRKVGLHELVGFEDVWAFEKKYAQ